MAEARASVNSIRLGTVHLEAVSTRAKLRGPQVASRGAFSGRIR